MQKTPKIIHQIWQDNTKPLTKYFKILGNTWKVHYPD